MPPWERYRPRIQNSKIEKPKSRGPTPNRPGFHKNEAVFCKCSFYRDRDKQHQTTLFKDVHHSLRGGLLSNILHTCPLNTKMRRNTNINQRYFGCQNGFRWGLKMRNKTNINQLYLFGFGGAWGPDLGLWFYSVQFLCWDGMNLEGCPESMCHFIGPLISPI